MTTHLYCVLPHVQRAALPAGLSGVAGARVRALNVDGVVAWVSDVARDIAVSIDGVKAHDAVVEAALDTGSTPIPMRFGQRFADDIACRDALHRQASSVESLLSNMQGLVEMTLILTPSTRRMIRDLEPVLPEMIEDGPGAGRRYMDSLRARESARGSVRRALDGVAAQLNDAVAAVVRKSASHENLSRMPFLTLSHLLRREDVAEYRTAAANVPRSTEVQFLVVGPRAPYSFCVLGGDGGTGAHGMRLAD